MNFLVFLISFFIQVNKADNNIIDNYEGAFVECENESVIENGDSLGFVLFFNNLVKDEILRNKSFETCDSKLKIILNQRLNQLEESIVFRNELICTDSVVSVLFYDDSLKFYKGIFTHSKEIWNLISLEKAEVFNVPVLKDLRMSKNRITYRPSCIDKNFSGVFDNYGEIDTVYSGKDLLTYTFSNSFIFYSENRKLSHDFNYRMLGLGSGINGYATFRSNCLFAYWDASN